MATKKYLSLERLTEYDELIKAEITEGDSSTLSSAKSYTNTEIEKITSGTTTVPEASHATTADSATTATTASSANVATKANQLSTARTISLSGDASGSASFDGSANAVISVTIADDSHNHVISNIDGLQSALDAKAATTYVDSAVSGLKNDLLNGAGEAYDTLKELGELIDENVDAIEALEEVAAGKANASHTHGNITNAGAIGTTSGKAVITTTNGVLTTGTVPIASGGTGATTAAAALTNLGLTATAAELNIMDGVTATTTEINYLDGVTSNIQTQLDGKSTVAFAQSLTSGTQVGTITIDGTATKLYAPTNTDTKNTAGSSNTSSKIYLIGATSQATNPQTYSHDTAYVGTDGCLYSGGSKVLTAHPTISTGTDTTSTAAPAFGGTFTAIDSVTRDSNGHVTAINTKTVTVPSSTATTSAAGLMSTAMVTKLNGIATGATKVTVDSALSSTSTNPVQNKIIYTAMSDLTSAVSANTSSITTLQTEVDSWEEITSDEIAALFA